MLASEQLPADVEIDVWEVHPHLDSSFDYAIFDNHAKAIEYAKEVVESVFDELWKIFSEIVCIISCSLPILCV